MFHVKQGGGGKANVLIGGGDVIVCVDSSVSGDGSHLLPSGGSGYGGGAATHTKPVSPCRRAVGSFKHWRRIHRLHASLDLQRLDVVE